MIDMNELKPILEVLIDGRDDGADIIEQVSSLDKPVEIDRSEIDALNARWNDRFKKAFFGEKGADIDESIPDVPVAEAEVPVEEDEVVEEDLTYDNLFTEVKEDKEED